MIRENRDTIKAYIKELGSRGAFDDKVSVLSEEESTDIEDVLGGSTDGTQGKANVSPYEQGQEEQKHSKVLDSVVGHAVISPSLTQICR